MFEGGCDSEVLLSAVSVEVVMEIHGAAKTQGLLVCQKPLENGHVGIRASPPKKVAGSIAQLKCIYTNVHSMGNKQEELEAIVQQESYDIVAITAIWWDDLHS
ncbi:maestro heat-like repeat-containing protein family member 7 [Grus japonensis]|uniref:Maestro heat-like repeat-containing protein family member 7 n=1 Tax=Grus japonensis TaxID=30415 RepID=A0ABC9W2X9_GRUJA